ncbi:MAG: hypothetical protein HGA47_06165 [Zoogloea sp.]|nr:hypothetical protein [Zoogloea sp.]
MIDSEAGRGCVIRVMGAVSYREVFDLKDWVAAALRVHPRVCLDLTQMRRSDRGGAELLHLLKGLGGGRVVVFDEGSALPEDGAGAEDGPLRMRSRNGENVLKTEEVR